MKFEIKSRWNSTTMFIAETASLKLAVEAAIKSSANLQGANLRGADLRYADLRGANLRGAYLRDADLHGANLQGANLRSADLQDADLRDAYLRGADLHGAYLQGANLQGANLQGANLQDADLRGANLRDADLRDANLQGADLRGAYLQVAYLQGANLQGANLQDANLRGAVNAELPQAQTIILPEGNLVGWKKCRDNVIVKLLIPQKAKRSNATGRKCRAEYAKVLRVIGANFGTSVHNPSVIYRKGETIHCDKWESNRFQECAGGIHFYITRVEAENH